MGKIDSKIRVEPAGNTAAKVEYWKQGIAVTMHFNDMCIRLRVLSVTVMATFFAGAAVSMAQYPDGVVSMLGIRAHVSAAIYSIAIVFVATLWLLDRAYYYKMLIASVEHSEDIEPKVRELVHDLIVGPTLTERLTTSIPRAASKRIANLFYFSQVFIGVVMILCSIDTSRAVAPIPSQQVMAEEPAMLRGKLPLEN